MSQRIAILDLGTNTFHLLIADTGDDRSISIVYKAEEFVQLGENGVELIGEQPFRRGLEQIKKYKAVLDQFQPDQITAFGTAAIRNAANGEAFIQQVKSICPMEIRKISGDEEAELIYLGVRQVVALSADPTLIMDIGGGSTEFIIANKEQLFWKQSFPVGASVLYRQFHHNEPISTAELESLQSFLNESLISLYRQKQNFQINRLIGASGSFDTFAMMIASQQSISLDFSVQTAFDFTPEQFQKLCQQLIEYNLQQRLEMKGMQSFRAAMITVAAVLTSVVLHQFGIQKITQSAYALKEGVLWKMVQKGNV